MNFTDIFIRRPVLATVVSLLILVLGLRAVGALPVLQYPRTENAVVTVTTQFYGADPATVAGFITTPLENAIAQANGIDYMTSNSQSGTSTITVNLRLNYDPDKALSEINTKISSVLNQLPVGTQQPILSVTVGQTIDAMYIGFYSDVLEPNQVTDYLVRAVQPKLQSVPGVQTAELLGAKNFALRAWLNPDKLAAYGLTATDVAQALANNDYISGLGTSKGQMVQVNLAASTDLHTLEQFRDMQIKQVNGAIIRMKDVANVSLGFDDYDSQVSFDGRRAVYFGIQVAPGANLLDVIKGVRDIFPSIQAQLPHGMTGTIVYDSTEFVSSSIHEVITTLVEAVLIVTLVVFAFLGSPRSVLIPVIAIPLSLIGTFTLMLAFGFSINLLTLLALVLAIGLVVDDAIIVVENVNRHLEQGMRPIPAAIQAARELGGPIIAMTVVLIAVYVPIGFQGGLTGALFTEFAFTLVGAVTVSAIIALTLSPMLCSRVLAPHTADRSGWEARLVDFIDRRFASLHRRYERRLHNSLNFLPVTLVFAAIVLGSIFFLYNSATSELAPQEDEGVVIALATPAPNATLQQRLMYDASDRPGLHQLPGDRPRVPARRPRPEHRRHGAETLGPARAHDQPVAAAGPAGVERDRRLPGGGVPAAFAARLQRAADPVCNRDNPIVRCVEQRGAAIPATRPREWAVHLRRQRSAHRPAAIDRGDRPRQGGIAGAEHEGYRRGARLDAGRRVRQLLQPRWSVL